MSDQRRIIWKSGGLTSTPINDGWAIDLDSRDPEIPNLPLESPAVPAASSDRALEPQFQTTNLRSRRHQTAVWHAALAPAQQAAVVPAAAWLGAAIRTPKPQRSTPRKLIRVEPMQWQYIAPTMAAILPTKRPAKILRIERKLTLPPPLAVFTQITPTGPPLTAWLAAALKQRVSQHKRLLVPPDQPAYPATSTPAIVLPAARSLTRRITERRLLTPLILPVYPQAAAPTVFVPSVNVLWRRITDRMLQRLPDQPDFPSTRYPVSYLPASQSIRRSETKRTLRELPDQPAYPATPVPLVYPSFVPTGYLFRESTERALLKQPNAPVYPQTPAAPAQAPLSAFTPARAIRRAELGRRLLPTLDIPSVRVTAQFPAYWPWINPYHEGMRRRLLSPAVVPVYPQPSAPPAAVLPAFTAAKALRREGDDRHLLTARVAPVYPAASTPPVVPLAAVIMRGHHHRNDTQRQRIAVPAVPVYPQASAAPVPLSAVARVTAYRRDETERHLQKAFVAPVFPPTPVVTYPGNVAAFTRITAIRRKPLRVTLLTPLPVLGAYAPNTAWLIDDQTSVVLSGGYGTVTVYSNWYGHYFKISP